MTLLAAYGTLRHNNGNHRVLHYNNDGTKFIGKTRINGFKMFSLGGFPGIVASDDVKDGIDIEVFSIGDKTLNSCRGLEGFYGKNDPHNMYNEEDVDTEFGKAKIYVWNGNPRETIIESGNWNKFINIQEI